MIMILAIRNKSVIYPAYMDNLMKKAVFQMVNKAPEGILLVIIQT